MKPNWQNKRWHYHFQTMDMLPMCIFLFVQGYVVTMLLRIVWLVLGTKNTWDRKKIMFWLSWPSHQGHGLKSSQHFVLFLQVVPMSH